MHEGTGSGSNKGLNELKGLGREAAEALYEATGWERSRKSLVRGEADKPGKGGGRAVTISG